ncbi:MAG: polysaccharide deacetylase family protein [Bacillota bacterium]
MQKRREIQSFFVRNGNKHYKKIALTFDGGGDADGAKAILDVLKKHHITSTFFLTGQWVEKFLNLAKSIVNDGHEIGNHTYSHPDLTTLSRKDIINEVTLGQQIIKQVLGKDTKPLFRQPYGHGNKEVLRATKLAGFDYSIHWSLDTLDWKQPSVEFITQRILNNITNGDIILMHLGGRQTGSALEIAIPELKYRGFDLVTVTNLLKGKNKR